MHEMSLAIEIRSLCERELAKTPEARLTGVGLDVGVFSGVELQSLRFCLEAVLGERYGDVSCEIRVEPGRAACPRCGGEFLVRRAPFECPSCEVRAWGVSGGDRLQLSYLEVE